MSGVLVSIASPLHVMEADSAEEAWARLRAVLAELACMLARLSGEERAPKEEPKAVARFYIGDDEQEAEEWISQKEPEPLDTLAIGSAIDAADHGKEVDECTASVLCEMDHEFGEELEEEDRGAACSGFAGLEFSVDQAWADLEDDDSHMVEQVVASDVTPRNKHKEKRQRRRQRQKEKKEEQAKSEARTHNAEEDKLVVQLEASLGDGDKDASVHDFPEAAMVPARSSLGARARLDWFVDTGKAKASHHDRDVVTDKEQDMAWKVVKGNHQHKRMGKHKGKDKSEEGKNNKGKGKGSCPPRPMLLVDWIAPLLDADAGSGAKVKNKGKDLGKGKGKRTQFSPDEQLEASLDEEDGANGILNETVDPKDESLKAFRLFDDDGKISFKNLKRVAKELGERMTDEELQEMVDEAEATTSEAFPGKRSASPERQAGAPWPADATIASYLC